MITRRGFLTTLGGVAVAATGAGTLRAVTQGVFDGPTGEAYAAWDAWDPPGDDVVGLVNAAVLAANAHNSQPWLFRLSPDQVEVIADTSRWIGAMDPLYREMQISLGCAVENLALAAAARGHRPTIDLHPNGATVHLNRGPAEDSPLYQAIPHRHTNRGAYAQRPVDLDRLTAMSDDVVQVVWVDQARFTDLAVRATEAIIADPDQTRDDYAWYRGERADLEARKDGVTIDASGQPDLIRALGKILPASPSTNNATWLASTRDTQLPTAAAIGTLVVKDPLDPVQRMRAGRLWQRMHLWATTQSIAMQPINQIEERMDREHATNPHPTAFTVRPSPDLPVHDSNYGTNFTPGKVPTEPHKSVRTDRSHGLTSTNPDPDPRHQAQPASTDPTPTDTHPTVTAEMRKLLPPNTHPVFSFRVGYPRQPATSSPRRPAREVLLP